MSIMTQLYKRAVYVRAVVSVLEDSQRTMIVYIIVILYGCSISNS